MKSLSYPVKYSYKMSLYLNVQTNPINKNNRNAAVRVVQVAWKLCTPSTETTQEYVVATDFEIDGQEYHGITAEIAATEGRPIGEILGELSETVRVHSPRIISHNLAFVKRCLKWEATLLKKDIAWLDDAPSLCTVLSTVDLVNIQGPYGAQYPTFSQLFEYLFGEAIDDYQPPHRARFSVETLHRVHNKLHQLDPAKF